MNPLRLNKNDPRLSDFNWRQDYVCHYELLHGAQRAPKIFRCDTEAFCFLSQFIELCDVPRGATHVVVVYKRDDPSKRFTAGLAWFAVADTRLRTLELLHGRAHVL
jgi:hypothetical protein